MFKFVLFGFEIHGNLTMLMHWTNLEDLLRDFFRVRPNERLYIFCPFINTKLISELLGNRNNVRIITSWRKDHLVSGVSNLDLYKLVTENPTWELFVNDRLHAKVFTHEFEEMLYGSANITRAALGNDAKSNYEFLDYGALSNEDQYSLKRIIDASTHVTAQVYEKYLNWFETLNKDYQLPEPDSLFTEDADNRFFISQLPASVSPSRMWEILSGTSKPEESWSEGNALQHDLDLFANGQKEFRNSAQYFDAIKAGVKMNVFVETFCEQITEEGMYFGRAKEWIQSNCEDDPVPYRKELTGYVQSLFEWLTELFPNRFEVDRPNFSHRIRRIG